MRSPGPQMAQGLGRVPPSPLIPSNTLPLRAPFTYCTPHSALWLDHFLNGFQSDPKGKEESILCKEWEWKRFQLTFEWGFSLLYYSQRRLMKTPWDCFYPLMPWHPCNLLGLRPDALMLGAGGQGQRRWGTSVHDPLGNWSAAPSGPKWSQEYRQGQQGRAAHPGSSPSSVSGSLSEQSLGLGTWTRGPSIPSRPDGLCWLVCFNIYT